MTNIKEQHEQDSTIWLMQQRSKPRECLLILDSSSSNIIHVTKDELHQKSPGKGIPGIQYIHKTDDHAFWKTEAFYNFECERERERERETYAHLGSGAPQSAQIRLSG
jgi:hypothetical protein